MAKSPKRAAASAGGNLKMSLKLDPAKIKRIQQCLKKGQLTITVAKVSSVARGENGYKYD
ncbi:aminopyruvatide family RiPP [Bradyrhizobium betae]|uniref:Uncharacterized protein n=1 Tax=Bradyrhizobium betae TaxID=244734 RepID=A0A4Q1V7I8_9BRAD|nr:Hsp20/alpha crystallin family protein [Bradyrhizobium betae]RXT47855.1 hypothetical protein B5V03_16500 [Bradyrhizobium betae]